MLKSVLNKFAMNEKVTSDMIMGDIIRFIRKSSIPSFLRGCTA